MSVIKNPYKNVFEEPSTSIKNFKIELQLREDAKPMFHRVYNVPYALRDKVESEIKKMENSGVLKKVSFSNWASPLSQRKIPQTLEFVSILRKP